MKNIINSLLSKNFDWRMRRLFIQGEFGSDLYVPKSRKGKRYVVNKVEKDELIKTYSDAAVRRTNTIAPFAISLFVISVLLFASLNDLIKPSGLDAILFLATGALLPINIVSVFFIEWRQKYLLSKDLKGVLFKYDLIPTKERVEGFKFLLPLREYLLKIRTKKLFPKGDKGSTLFVPRGLLGDKYYVSEDQKERFLYLYKRDMEQRAELASRFLVPWAFIGLVVVLGYHPYVSEELPALLFLIIPLSFFFLVGSLLFLVFVVVFSFYKAAELRKKVNELLSDLGLKSVEDEDIEAPNGKFLRWVSYNKLHILIYFYLLWVIWRSYQDGSFSTLFEKILGA